LKGDFESIYWHTVESFSLPKLSSNQLLILRAAGDEASGILTTSAFASWVIARLSRFIHLSYRIGGVLGNVSDKIRAWAGDKAEVTVRKLAAFYVLLPLLIAAFIFCSLYVVVLIPLLVLCIFFSLPFGIDAALAASLVEFSSEGSPPGTFATLSLTASTAKGLWHSLPYNDPEAFKAIVDWINGHREEEEIRLRDLAVAIRNYLLSRNRFDWREVEDRLTALEASHQKMANNLSLPAGFDSHFVENGLREDDLRKPLMPVLLELADAFRSLRTFSGRNLELRIRELGEIADRLDTLDNDLPTQIKTFNRNMSKMFDELSKKRGLGG
jgi:hypothetical protein